MPRRLVQQRMTLSDLEWALSDSASRAISAVAELLCVYYDSVFLEFAFTVNQVVSACAKCRPMHSVHFCVKAF